MEQFEQLLTCAICLDRYRNPKLLPCQHSFCMEPCLEGLVDYVRRQVREITSITSLKMTNIHSGLTKSIIQSFSKTNRIMKLN